MHKVINSQLLRIISIFMIAFCFPFISANAGLDKGTVEPADKNMKEGIKRIQSRDYEGAVDSFLQSIYFSRNHYNPSAYLYLGLSYKAMRQYTKAIEALNNHLKQITEPGYDARIDLAECYMNIGQFDKARREIDQARAESPSGMHARSIYAMGELHEKMGNVGEALGHYEAAIEASTRMGEAWMGKARCEVKLGQHVKAIKDYREILERGPTMSHINYEEVYVNMAGCLYKRGDHQGAIDHYLYALKENPDSFDAHLSLASIFDEEKHLSSAIHEYELSLSTAPKEYNTEKIKKRLQYLESKLKSEQAPKPVTKPSPVMRQEAEKVAPPKDSGF